MQLQLEAFGDIQASRNLLRFSESALNLRPVLEDIEDDFYALEREQFRTEGGRGGAAWPALSDDYARWKAIHYPGKPILQREGDLLDSLTGGGQRTLTDDELVILGAPHGVFHQNARLPRNVRKPVNLTTADRNRWTKMLQRHIVTGGSSADGLSGIEGIL